MSSYVEFLEEAKALSSPQAEHYPVAVPHSRPRGTWANWAREITIPDHVLDLIVQRYDSKSWTAAGGRESGASGVTGGSKSSELPCSAALSSQDDTQRKLYSRAASGEKEGGATELMRGVCRPRVSGLSEDARPRNSGRARALRLRSERVLESASPGRVDLLQHIL